MLIHHKSFIYKLISPDRFKWLSATLKLIIFGLTCSHSFVFSLCDMDVSLIKVGIPINFNIILIKIKQIIMTSKFEFQMVY